MSTTADDLTEKQPEQAELEGEEFEALLEDLKQTRGFDFTGYKRASLRRRIALRMQEVGIDDISGYHDHLQVTPDEFAQLFNTILINVTRFFRDPEHWQYLREEILPAVVEAAGGEQVRVWSAGCASGEEAYTLAILLAELLGPERFEDRVKIYATDVDEDALDHARHATYDQTALEAVPEEFRERYFEPTGSRFAVRDDLRRGVIFGRHDLVSDAPISRLHLLVCRNVLMYFNRETQAKVLRHLHFGLRDDGFLFLGRAEMLLTRSEMFEPVDLSHRVFRTTHGSVPALQLPATGRSSSPNVVTRQVRLRDAAFAAAPVAQVVVDAEGRLVLANEQARTTFGLGAQDIGRPLQDLELSYRPIELRGPIEEVQHERRARHLRNIERQVRDGHTEHFDVWLIPLEDGDGELLGVSATFEDITGPEELRERLQQTTQDLETAYEELQSTNEELETANEELQSTVEELETTNEELQSSNEELETMNEELQSANAEQEEINHELMVRTEEIEHLNAHLRSILRSLHVGVVVVGTDFEVQVWNEGAFELWGLREDEVAGRSLLNLDIGLDVGDLADPIRECLQSGELASVTLQATNRRGRQVDCAVQMTPLVGGDGRREGVVVLMEAATGDGEGESGDDG